MMEIFNGIILIIVGALVTYLIASHNREKKKRDLHYTKVDCIIYAFRSVNHGIGTEFGKAYDKRFAEVSKENEYINN